MIFVAAMLCLAALLWMLLRKRGHAERRPAIDAELFDGENAGDLFQTAPIGYLEIDRKGIVRRVNRTECKLRGWTQTPCWACIARNWSRRWSGHGIANISSEKWRG